MVGLIYLFLGIENALKEEALRELDTMYKVYLGDPAGQFRISRVVTLTKKQKLILKEEMERLRTLGDPQRQAA